MYSKLSDQQKLSMRAEYWSGIPVSEICKNYEISESTAYFWIAPNRFKEYSADLGMEIIIRKEFCDTQRSIKRLNTIVEVLREATCNAESPLEERLSEFIRLSPVYGKNVTLEALIFQRVLIITELFVSTNLHAMNYITRKSVMPFSESLTRASSAMELIRFLLFSNRKAITHQRNMFSA